MTRKRGRTFEAGLEKLERRLIARYGPETPPECPMCRRAFEDVFDFPRATVVAVKRVKPPSRPRDRMARADNRRKDLSESLAGLVQVTAVRKYIDRLVSLVGKDVKPAALKPRNMGDQDLTGAWRVPGAPRRPSEDWTWWTLTLSTRWRKGGREADLLVMASVGGHSLGSEYGPLSIDVAPVFRVRVRPDPPSGRANQRSAR